MFCKRCEKTYLSDNDINHTKENCDKQQIPLTDEEFKEMSERIFQWEIEQGNYGKKFNEGFRRLQTMIKENIK